MLLFLFTLPCCACIGLLLALCLGTGWGAGGLCNSCLWEPGEPWARLFHVWCPLCWGQPRALHRLLLWTLVTNNTTWTPVRHCSGCFLWTMTMKLQIQWWIQIFFSVSALVTTNMQQRKYSAQPLQATKKMIKRLMWCLFHLNSIWHYSPFYKGGQG